MKFALADGFKINKYPEALHDYSMPRYRRAVAAITVSMANAGSLCVALR